MSSKVDLSQSPSIEINPTAILIVLNLSNLRAPIVQFLGNLLNFLDLDLDLDIVPGGLDFLLLMAMTSIYLILARNDFYESDVHVPVKPEPAESLLFLCLYSTFTSTPMSLFRSGDIMLTPAMTFLRGVKGVFSALS